MKIRDLRAAIARADDDAEAVVLNTYNGEGYSIEDISIDPNGNVYFESYF